MLCACVIYNNSEEVFLEIVFEIRTTESDPWGMVSCQTPGFQGEISGTWVPGGQIPGGYEALLVSVAGIGRPGSTREYPGD